MQSTPNAFLIVGAMLSAVAALLHFGCIFWGAAGFRYLGAGERIVRMVARGHWYPRFVAFAIGILLSVWSLYALSGAGAIGRLPYVPVALSAITLIYLLRAITFPLLKPAFPGNSDVFWYTSSTVSLAIGLTHFVGLVQVWKYL